MIIDSSRELGVLAAVSFVSARPLLLSQSLAELHKCRSIMICTSYIII